MNPIFRTFVVVSVSVLIVFGNLLNLRTLRMTKQIPAISRMCLLNLSCSDLIVGVVACVPCVYPAATGHWPYGAIWCQIAGITHGMSVTVSIWSLVLVSVDRYVAVVHPLRYHAYLSEQRCGRVLVAIWTLAFLTYSSVLPFYGFVYYEYSPAEAMCGLHWANPWFCIITGLFVPMMSGAVLAFTASGIGRTVAAMNRVGVAQTASVGAPTTSASRCDTEIKVKQTHSSVTDSSQQLTARDPQRINNEPNAVVKVAKINNFPDLPKIVHQSLHKHNEDAKSSTKQKGAHARTTGNSIVADVTDTDSGAATSVTTHWRQASRSAPEAVDDTGRRERKMMKLLIVTVLALFTCWGPYTVINVLLIAILKNRQVSTMMRFVTTWLGNSNSFVNIVIYSFVYSMFRKNAAEAIGTMFFCRRACRSDSASATIDGVTDQSHRNTVQCEEAATRSNVDI